MSKKMVFIVLPVAGLLSFSLAFVFGWSTKPVPLVPQDSNMVHEQTLAHQQAELGMGPQGAMVSVESQIDRVMTERQLKDLVLQVRNKIQEYEGRLASLNRLEERLALTQNGVKEDMKKLSDLRVEVAQVIADLKMQRDALEKTRIKINDNERDNLKMLAMTYAKMEADSAGRLLANMIRTPMTGDPAKDEKINIDDAVKILHFMKETNQAEILTALIDSEPRLAGVLSQKLKRVFEDW